MAKPKINLSDFDEMLNFEQESKSPAAEGVPAPQMGGMMEMDFDQMESFPNHRFKLYEGQRLTDMMDSIKQFGVLLPLIVWHTEDGKNIILSGHNRKNAGQLAGLTKGPVIIKENLTFHEARLIETLLNPHEIKENQTSAEVQHRLKSRDKIGQEYGLSRDKVAKYIRLAGLVSDLMERVDTGEIAFLAAYDLSFVEDTAKQQQIADLMESDSYKVDMKKAGLLRSYYETSKLTDTAIVQILSGEKTRKPKSDKPQPFKIKPTVISKYFTTQQTTKEIEEIIDRALAFYFENWEQEMEGTV